MNIPKPSEFSPLLHSTLGSQSWSRNDTIIFLLVMEFPGRCLRHLPHIAAAGYPSLVSQLGRGYRTRVIKSGYLQVPVSNDIAAWKLADG